MNKYFPSRIIDSTEIREQKLSYAVVVLNRPISLERHLVETLWNNSSINITVDGGTNRWLTFLNTHGFEEKLRHPDLITGDLDSCNADSLAFFTHTRVIQTIDQDETDFTKCLRVLEPFVAELRLEHVVVICENSGRLDHIVANINTLHKHAISRPVFVLASTSVSWLLAAGEHEIQIPERVRKLWCALMPMTGATKVSTEGLKWNMQDFRMEFGGLVSTSNKYDGVSECVRVKCEKPVLWSMGIEHED